MTFVGMIAAAQVFLRMMVITIPLSLINLLGLFLLSRHLRIGWLFTVLGETLWGVYGVSTGQWGLALGGFVTAVVQCFAWVRWRRARC